LETSIPFVPGLQLSERLYRDGVAPILVHHFPRLRYAAARLGRGSDVLGFDTPRSRDHDWGPQLGLFFAEADFSPDLAQHIRKLLADELPFEIAGYPTHSSRSPTWASDQMAK
jgi:hypothetical protein